MRGVISLALAMILTETEYKRIIVTTTLTVVLISIIVFGGGMSPFLTYMFNNPAPFGMHESALATEQPSQSDARVTSEEESIIERFDKEYFLPFFTKTQYNPTSTQLPNYRYDTVQAENHSDIDQAELASDSSTSDSTSVQDL